jgi:DDE superfamily endonuclease
MWSTRTLAARLGIGKDAVAKIWADHNLKPWKVDTFKISNDPRFEEKLVDVVGLYLNPPQRAAVFCFDEKTQCQALDRTQPSLPMKPGRAGTMTHDYKRNGTIDLFAAMNVATGQVLTDLRKEHTGADVLAFFKQIDKAVPRELDVHVVLDNLSAHSTPRHREVVGPQGPSPLAPALHPDLQFMVEPRRAVVQRTHRQAPAARRVHLRHRPRCRDQHVGTALEQRPQAVHVEGDRRRHHRQGPTRPRHTPPDQITDGPPVRPAWSAKAVLNSAQPRGDAPIASNRCAIS